MRVFVVGTGTAVGKTSLCVALLHAARRRAIAAVPFKPVQSGDDDPSDAARLTEAAGLPASCRDRVNPSRFAAPLAPGLADDPAAFLPGGPPPDDAPLRAAAAALDAWDLARRARLVLIEGAGGLHVPMPGGTWQSDWVVALAADTLVVGAAGLGTIHHTLATIEGLRALGRPPRGFVLSHVDAPDPSEALNPAVIERRADVPFLGALPPDPSAHVDAADPILDALLAS
jgi:dethiobiotin synthetase